MRLIDEEALMEDMQKTITEQSGTIDWLNLISRQPTAYDVDKVVEQTHNYLIKIVGPHSKLYQNIMAIIRSGGKEQE